MRRSRTMRRTRTRSMRRTRTRSMRGGKVCMPTSTGQQICGSGGSRRRSRTMRGGTRTFPDSATIANAPRTGTCATTGVCNR